MAISTGTRSLISTAAGWVLVAGTGAFAIAHYETLKSAAGLPPSTGLADRPAAAAQRRTGAVVELSADRSGHFQTDAEINGRAIPFLVDTGATVVALSYEDAERAGLFLQDRDFTHRVSTANGVARVAPVTLDRVSIGDITVRRVQAAVSEPRRLQTSLLGMSFLSRLSRFDMRNGRLVLED